MKFASREYWELKGKMTQYEDFTPVKYTCQEGVTVELSRAVHAAVEAVTQSFIDEKKREVYEAAVAFVKACEAED